MMADVKQAAESSWSPPRFSVKWPDYFRPNAEDAQKTFTAIKVGIDAKFVTIRKAVEMAQRILHVDNVDAYLDSLEEEQQDKQAKADEQAQKQAEHELELMKAAGHEKQDGVDQGGKRPGAGTPPAPQAGSGSGAPPAPPPKVPPAVGGKR